jgi:mono/diheme cytochrome c family protein
MKLKIAVVAMTGLAAFGLSNSSLHAQATRTTGEGVYTKAQSDQGRAKYAQACAVCHGAALAGGDSAPPLAGADFMANWNGQTVQDLFDKINKTMPLGKEGTLDRDTTAAITTFILSSNGMPAGSTPLDNKEENLKAIKIETKK